MDIPVQSHSEQYENRYIAFVDILGFADIVERTKTSPILVREVNQALSQISKRAEAARSSGIGFAATTFSDTILLSAPVSADGVFRLLEMIDDLSIDLLSARMLFRGAVVKGSILHSSSAVFGPGLIAAYKLETGTSFHPRIILNSDVFDDAKRFSEAGRQAEFEKRIIEDSYDIPYLNPFARWHDHVGEWSTADLEKLIQLQLIVASGLIQNGRFPPIAEKYKWLARKMNGFVKRMGLEEKIAEIDVG